MIRDGIDAAGDSELFRRDSVSHVLEGAAYGG